MRIAVLGPLEVFGDDGAPVAVPGAKERLLLAVLSAGSPGVVSTDRIVEQLWNGDQPVAARKSLQVHLVHLRTALEPDRPRGSTGRYVVRRGTGYALATGDVDALQLTRLAARGRAVLASGAPAEAVRLLSTALDLWRGDPYGDWPDASFADAERRRLSEVRIGAETALLEAHLALGQPAEVIAEAERLLTGDPLKEDWWRLLVHALYRAGRQGDALAAVARARTLLAEALGTDPGPGLRAIEAAVLAQDPALDPPVPAPNARPTPGVSACPYKGLSAYQAADAALFHGRGRMVTRLVGRLVDAPLMVISGSSGAGKSSLVRAGLIPALSAGALPGSPAWRAQVVTPGRRPVDALAALTRETGPSPPVLLVVDQFEELWAPGVDADERAAFLDTVLGLIDDGILVRCVAVLRCDHVGRLAEHATFTERVGTALVLVPPLTEDEIRDVVRGPAAAVGLLPDTELLDAVVADVAGRPAALPLLSTALVGTWERRQRERLTLGGYLASGGVAGALTRSAEDAYSELDEAGQEPARRLLVRLAEVDDGGALVRRRVSLAEIDLDGEDGAMRRAVVETFVARRLLSVDGNLLEVTHEALLTGWPRLARWLEDDAAGRAVRRHLAPAARDWTDGGRPEEELYRGARLAAALDWAAGADSDVSPLEGEFLDASRAHADAELEEARERARHEARARHRARRMAVGLAAVLVVALVAAALAVRSQRAAERTSLTADANRLAALSTTVGSLDLAFLLAAAGFRLADTPETQDALLAALGEHRRAAHVVPYTGATFGGNLGNGGRTLVMGVGRQILSWEIESGKPPEVLVDLEAQGPWDGWRGTNASPTDDRTVYVGAGEDGPWIRLADGAGRVTLLPDGAQGEGSPIGAAFTADGRLLDVFVATSVAGGGPSWRLVQIDPAGGAPRDSGIAGTLAADGGELDVDIAEDASSAIVWSSKDTSQAVFVDLVSRNQEPVALPRRAVPPTEYRALPSGAAVLWDDGQVTLVDRAGASVQDIDAHRLPVRDVALAPDGSWAATVGQGGEIVLWDVDRVTGHWLRRESLDGHSGDVMDAEITPASDRLVTMSRDNTLIAWDVTPDGGFGTSHPGVAGRWVANAPAVVEPGRLVVAPTRPLPADGQAIPYLGAETLGVAATFLDPRTGRVVDQVDAGHTVADAYFGSSVAVSRDRRWIAVTSGLATTVLDGRTREVVTRIELPPNGDAGVGGDTYPAGVVCCAVWTRDGTRLLLGTGGYLPGTLVDGAPRDPGEIAVVDTSTWKVVDHVPLDRVPEVLTLDRDGRWLAVASANTEEVVVLDGDTLQERHRVALSVDDSLWSMSFSPDGRLLAGGGEARKIHVIDTGTWVAREAVPVRDAELVQLEWLPDNRTVVTTSVDGAVQLFDTHRAVVRGAALPASIDGEPGYARVVPEPDDQIVALNDQWAGLRYPTDPSVWLREACAVAGRDLTRPEWDRFLPGREWQPTCSDLG
ncbi:MAG: putative Transcriptional regulator [Blastococcus sp.]|nr:putative Transcriptional regulator [Blastococcus sp.]